MSKNNDVSTLDHRPLADSELDAVSGGLVAVKTVSWAYDDESPKETLTLPPSMPFVTLGRG